ncbi:DUF481 domain-containing protein [Cytophagaceae bacterium ABcell3]|nr:DUF481 domain-containing protein [Cytophagaceae bacterium ABcell3]
MNIEKTRLERKDTANYFVGNVSASLSMYNRSAGEKDPVNLLGFNSGADFGYISKNHVYMLIGKFDYLKINENVFLSTGYVHFRTSFNHNETIHPEFFTQYQYDNFRGLDPRLLTGGAIRYRLIKSKSINITLSTGAMLEYEQWQHPYEANNFQQVTLIKSTSNISTRWKIKEHIDLNTIFYFQTGYDNSIKAFRHRYSGEANLLVKVTERLSLKTTFTGNYENRPIVPITPFIYSLTNGFQINL